MLLCVGLGWQWIAGSLEAGLFEEGTCTRKPSFTLQRGKLDAWAISWFHDWLIDNLLDQLHTEILLRNSKGFVGRDFCLKVKRIKWLSFHKSSWLLWANQKVSWENSCCFCKLYEGWVKDYLIDLGISIIRLRDTESSWKSCFSPSSDISVSMYSPQKGWDIDWKDE